MKTKRFLSMLLCACMMFTLLPAAKLTAEAASTTAITLGTDGISGSGQNWVYFGEYNKGPVKWRVLSNSGNGGLYSDGSRVVTKPLFLMSEYTLDYDLVQFDPGSNAWKDSGAQIWCNSFYKNNFDAAEKTAIASTTKSDSKYSNYERSALTGDLIFFLSGEEAANSAYGFTSDNTRVAYPISSSSHNSSSRFFAVAMSLSISRRIFCFHDVPRFLCSHSLYASVFPLFLVSAIG